MSTIDKISRPHLRLMQKVRMWACKAEIVCGEPDCAINIQLLGIGPTKADAYERLVADAAYYGHMLPGSKS